MSEYTAEDFAQANLATRGRGDVARRVDDDHVPWLIVPDGRDVAAWRDDDYMARDGWVPVVEADWPVITEHTLRDSQEKAARKREKLVDHIADQDRVIRRRNDEIAALRAELRDAQAPLSPDDLEAAWEAAEVPTEEAPIREGDVVIEKISDSAYAVMSPPPTCGLVGREFRILSRAPEPWQDLADDLADRSALMDEDAIEAAAKALHLAGWRKGGDEV